tara:strand:- start:9238 stop:9630 length:393 start_codon:yes stop_codon:yes gene_type:complete
MGKDKINYSHDPGIFLNAFLSMSRNFFLTASISVAIFGLGMQSRVYKKKKRLYILSLFIMIFSIIYGIKTTRDFDFYINYLIDNAYFDNEFLKQHAERWRGWIYLNILFIILIISGVLIEFYKLLVILNK